jgi:hypothetical protein
MNATPRLLYSWNEHPDPSYSRLGRPQGRSGRVSRTENILPLPGVRTPNRPARGESLYWLRYPSPDERGKIYNFSSMHGNKININLSPRCHDWLRARLFIAEAWFHIDISRQIVAVIIYRWIPVIKSVGKIPWCNLLYIIFSLKTSGYFVYHQV